MRRSDPKAVKLARKDRCEYCGRPASGEPHHLRPRSLGGRDAKENLIQLCPDCHLRAHSGLISPRALMEIVARREGVSPEEVARATGWSRAESRLEAAAANFCRACGRYLTREQRLAGKETCGCGLPAAKPLPSLEELLQVFVSCREKEEEGKWGQAAALVVMRLGLKMSARQVSAETGLSPALVREMVRTFEAFPEEEMRVPELSFYHHRLASKTSDPQKWIALAADNQWSTRQMADKIRLAECRTGEAEEEALLAKAERALRMAGEVVEAGGRPAEWLKEKLAALIALPGKTDGKGFLYGGGVQAGGRGPGLPRDFGAQA